MSDKEKMPDVIPQVVAEEVSDDELEKTLDNFCEFSRQKYIELELQRLNKAVDKFSQSMKIRLKKKLLEGYSGWDDPKSVSSKELADSINKDSFDIMQHHHYRNFPNLNGFISCRIEKRARKRISVDMANRAMMLWYRENCKSHKSNSEFVLKSKEEIQNAVLRQCQTSKKQNSELFKDINKKTLKDMATEYGFDTYEFNQKIPNSVIEKIPKNIAMRYEVIPVAFENGVLTVAFSDPTNLELFDSLRYILRCHIEGVVSELSQIKEALITYY